MSLIKMTVREIMDLGLWEKVCKYKGYDEWILNEGKIGENDTIEFDTEFKVKDEDDDLDKELTYEIYSIDDLGNSEFEFINTTVAMSEESLVSAIRGIYSEGRYVNKITLGDSE